MGLFQKVHRLLHRGKLETEMTEEMRHHVELQTELNRKAGMKPEDARYAALRQFGNVASLQERAREVRGWRWLEELTRDIRYAAGSLHRHPAFAAGVIATLALGLGATATIFTITDAMMWRPLPYRAPDELIASPRFTTQLARDWQARNGAIAEMECHLPRNMILTGGAEPMEIAADAVSPGLFSLLGRMPSLGRPFVADDAESGNHRVTILSHEFWQRNFGGESSVVGRQLTLDGEPFLVVGVMPRGFAFPRRHFDLWIPRIRAASPEALRQRVEVVARLRPGATLPIANNALQVLLADSGDRNSPAKGRVVEFRMLDGLRANSEPRRLILLALGAVGFVLLVACSNVANLLLVRGVARQREFAVRGALGAGRGRLLRQVLAECLLLVGLGVLGGTLFAHWAVGAIWALTPMEMTFLTVNEVTLDWRALAFVSGLGALATLVCGLVPAWRASRVAVLETLGGGGRGFTGSRRQQQWQQGFVVIQGALACVLLVAAGLLMRGFVRVASVSPGFEPKNLAALSLQLPSTHYGSAALRQGFLEQLRDRIASVPGVSATSLAAAIPPRAGAFYLAAEMEIEGRAPQKLPASDLLPYNTVDDDYFRVMGIPVVRGRAFDARDIKGAAPVIMINTGMAAHFWPGQNPIGQRLRLDARQPWQTVIGVVGDVRALGLADRQGRLEYYRSTRQEGYGGYFTVILRTAVDPQQVLPAVRREVAALDGRLPVGQLATATDLLAGSLAIPRFCLALMAAFAGVAILMAAIGLYAVMSYTVTQRTSEIGVRLALGARPADLVWFVARRGFLLTGCGLAIGTAAAAGLTRLLGSLLYEVSPLDPVTFGGVIILLGLVGLAACWLPARRAAKVDPMIALRAE